MAEKKNRNPLVVALVSFLVGLGAMFAAQKGLDLRPAQPAAEEVVNQGIDAAVDAVRDATKAKAKE